MAPGSPQARPHYIACLCYPLIGVSSSLWALLNHKHLLLIKSQNPELGCTLHKGFWQRRKRRKLEKRKMLSNSEWRGK